MSGLVAMLAAAEVMGNSSLAADFKRRIVFAAFAGEPWGYMGSKRLLWELAKRENSTEGLALANIEQVRHLPYYGLEPHAIPHVPRLIRRHSQTGLSLMYVWSGLNGYVAHGDLIPQSAGDRAGPGRQGRQQQWPATAVLPQPGWRRFWGRESNLGCPAESQPGCPRGDNIILKDGSCHSHSTTLFCIIGQGIW